MARRRDRRGAWLAAIGAASLGLLLALASDANARKLQMSGTWAVREGGVFLPLQFAETLPAPRRHTSMGDLSKAFFFPNGPIAGSGLASATGSAPATLRVPAHGFRSSAFAAAPFCGAATLVQLTTMFIFDGPHETARLVAGGGPGSFQWCPNDVLGCPVTGPPSGGARNGRVIYVAGANQFGGAMQIGLGGGGIQSRVFHFVPYQIGHFYFGGTGPTPRASAVGRGSPEDPSTRMRYVPPGVVTQPTMVPTSCILAPFPGPKLTTMLGLSTTGSGPIYRLLQLGTSAGGMSVGVSTTEFGFAHTTGTVIVQQTSGSGGASFFTVMGSDMRTALGAGNISTVAGGISFRNTLGSQTPYATFHKVWFSLAPPVPSLSPAAVAAAGALILLAVGYALRR